MNELKITTGSDLLNPKKWVSAYADYLYQYAITRLNDEEKARDLVQDTFLAALQSMNKFAGKSTERTWLTAILKNKIYDEYRKKASGLKIEGLNNVGIQDEDFFDEYGHWRKEYAPQTFMGDDFDPTANKELSKVLQQCLQKLPPLWMAVFTMKHMDDEATDLVCTELRLSQANFWVIIHRAKLNLRACLQKNWM